MAYDARTHEKIDPVFVGDEYYCDRCKEEVRLQRKMYCWLCSNCSLVLINE